MAEQFHVVFEGRIAEHADLDMVKHNVGRAFKLPPEQVDKLFSGKRIALKKNVDQSTAEKYRATLERAGALCEVINSDPAARQSATQATPEPAAASAQAVPKSESVAEPSAESAQATPESTANESAAPAEDDSGMSMAEVGVTLIKSEPVPDANIDTSDMDMDEVGVTLVESEPVPDANIDTSGMDMDEVGVTLIESEPVPDANIDTSGMDMDEVGVTLIESEPVPDANIDTSGMDMAEAGITLIESEPVPDADIDTSSLSLSD